MEKWSAGQIELFRVLGKICEKIGREGAAELVRDENGEGSAFNVSDGELFLGGLERLRAKAEMVDELQRENERLKFDLEKALRGRFDGKSEEEVAKAGNENNAVKTPSFGEHGEENLVDKQKFGHDVSREHLMQKHMALLRGHKELLLAREQIEKKLRSSQKSTKEWVAYANALEKRIEKLEQKLTQHGIPLKRHYLAANTTAGGPANDGDAVLILTAPSGGQQGRTESHDTALHTSEADLGNDLDSKKPSPAVISWQGATVAAEIQHGTANPTSSDQCDSGTTEGDIGGIPNKLPYNHIDEPAPVIKAESLSDTPVVISCKSVRKKRARSGEILTESTVNIKVKVETVTSSPIGLAGFSNMIADESMDLDDIGEKMNTPKKRRRSTHASGSEIKSSASQKLLAEAGAVQEGGRIEQSKRRHSVLQPASPNKQILPRTSGKEKAPKLRRLEDQLLAAVILGEDGENYVARRIPTEAEIEGKPPRELNPSLLRLDRRLTGLLEEPSPKSEILTPAKPVHFPTILAQNQARIPSTDKNQGLTTAAKHQFGAGKSPNTTVISRDTPKTDHKASTAKKRSFGTPKGVGSFDANNTDQVPLRARPLRLLSLEHFKINPHLNQGSDYAFADVVRGRELRKCLPGCTKSECCGDKFRKLIELSMDHEKQTTSQEAENEKLLRNYLGDNRGRLRNIAPNERQELLVQAKARELANKASRHRHAYERPRSPPGFWRSDFPSTQELMNDRQEAANRERELVRRRYEEAMRPGGRWLFRDE